MRGCNVRAREKEKERRGTDRDKAIDPRSLNMTCQTDRMVLLNSFAYLDQSNECFFYSRPICCTSSSSFIDKHIYFGAEKDQGTLYI